MFGTMLLMGLKRTLVVVSLIGGVPTVEYPLGAKEVPAAEQPHVPENSQAAAATDQQLAELLPVAGTSVPTVLRSDLGYTPAGERAHFTTPPPTVILRPSKWLGER